LKRILAFLLALMAWPAFAGIADAPPETLQVSLITYGPGDIYWERFGHDAIELRDPVSGEAIAFNYGVFDFDEQGFLLNFARGVMHYRMDAGPTAEETQFYRDEGRQVTRQQLALTPAQTTDLRRFLFWNIQPANVGYNYDYYVDNCAIRVRDALDRALGGRLRTAIEPRTGGMTYREQTARLMSNQTWLMVAMDMGLGPYADQPMNAWKESFLPMVLQQQVANLQVPDANGQLHPLVASTQILAKATIEQPPETAPKLGLPLLLAGLILAALIALTAMKARIAFGLIGTLWLLFAGIVGLTLAALWGLTLHRSAWANANLLLMNPLAFGLIPAVWKGFGPKSRALTWLLLGLAIVALLLHLIPGYTQRNLPWIGFALPIWAALTFAMWRRCDCPVTTAAA
jgi:hypothetical protein